MVNGADETQAAIRRCLSGDRDAFRQIVTQFQRPIARLCLRLTGSREDAADCAQQAFIQAYRHLDQYDCGYPFHSWLQKIATNQCIALLRSRPYQGSPADSERLLDLPDERPDAPALVEWLADQRSVREAVARLPDPYRQVLVSYYFAELSYQEISRQSGLSVGTVSTHLYRAKRLLRRILLAEGVNPDGAPVRAAIPTVFSR